MRFYILIAAVGFLMMSCSREFTKIQKNGTVEEKYKAAMKYFNDADYYKATVLFEEITPMLRGDSTAENTQFYNAYANYYMGNYQMSSYLFNSFYATYNNSQMAEEAFYMYAHSMFKDAPPYNLDQTNSMTAIDALQTFINTYPDSKYADQITGELSDLRERLERKAYEKAALYYKTRDKSWGGLANYLASVVTIDNFKKDFPDSKYIEELSYRQIKAQFELAELSYYTKQRERYTDAINYYHAFVDKFPASKYIKELERIYDKAQVGLSDAIKFEEQIEKEKQRIEEEKQKKEDKAK